MQLDHLNSWLFLQNLDVPCIVSNLCVITWNLSLEFVTKLIFNITKLKQSHLGKLTCVNPTCLLIFWYSILFHFMGDQNIPEIVRQLSYMNYLLLLNSTPAYVPLQSLQFEIDKVNTLIQQIENHIASILIMCSHSERLHNLHQVHKPSIHRLHQTVLAIFQNGQV